MAQRDLTSASFGEPPKTMRLSVEEVGMWRQWLRDRVGDHNPGPDMLCNMAAAYPILIAALYAALEYAEPEVDVLDGNDGFPRPNKAMNLVQTLREALRAVGEKL